MATVPDLTLERDVGQTIFERYGGFAEMRKVVSDFYDVVLDSELAHHFAATDMRELIKHQTSFITYLTGGPGEGFSDDVLRRVHAPLGIREAEFDLMLTLLSETLEDHEFDAEAVREVTSSFEERRGVIVSRDPAT